MVIAVNTRFLMNDCLEGYGYFIYENFKRIIPSHPEHQFIFIFDRPYHPRFVFAPNITPVVAGPPARHPLLWKLWYDIRVPAILKKHNADIFVSCDGFCSLSTKVPQCLAVHDLSFLHFPAFIRKSYFAFYRHFTPKFLKKARRLITVSDFSRKDIIRQYPFAADKISIVPNAARSAFQPLDEIRKQRVKEELTGGREYFLYAGSIHPRKNLMNLLKAFSTFKKKQKSNWKLVLAGRLAWKYRQFVESLKTYKYREDVVLTGYLEEGELARVMGAAYALVYPSLWEGFGMPVLEAMACRVPAITSENSPMQELAGEAALYVNPADHHSIAEEMQHIYKDERLRSELIEKGSTIADEYNWDRSAAILWQTILKTLS